MAHYGDPIGQIVKDRFKSFLSDYKEEVSMGDSSQGDMEPGLEVYKRQIAKMREVNLTVMIVDYSHLTAFDAPLAASVAEEFIRFEPYIKLALQELIKEVAEDFLYEENVAEPRDFYVAFFNMPATIRVRELKTGTLGSLVTICGTVTRTSEVRPELLYGRFACSECGAMSPPIEQQFKFTEPAACSNRDCLNRGSWSLDTSSSRFVDWQSVRVQENADEIPAGSLPRTITVILRHNAVEKAKAGDKCLFTGTLVVTPDVSALYKAGTLPTAMRGGG